jgi:hypothetical protein
MNSHYGVIASGRRERGNLAVTAKKIESLLTKDSKRPVFR